VKAEGEPGSVPMIRPPRLHLGREGTASRLELFFDLAYVLVIMQLAIAFVDDLSWLGLAELAGLFVAIWFSWVGFTLYANRFDTDDVVFRVAQLIGTAAIAGCAAAATDGLGSTSAPFAACFLLGRVVLLGLYLRAWWYVPDGRPTVGVYLASTSTAATLWAVSLLVPPPARFVLWAVAVAADAAGPVIATWRGNTAPLHMEHLPERFGLFVILVLGEMVAAVVTGVHDAKWSALPVAVSAIGFVVAAALWWSYFDVASARGNDELQDADDAIDERHDLYIYGHLPLTLGIAAAGVGLEEMILHPDAELPAPPGWAAIAGIGLCLLGAGIILAGTHQRLSAMWPWPTIALAPLAAYALLPISPPLLVSLLALTVVIVAITGARRLAPESDAKLSL
jgi:low temperature requirement protein LtrA